MKDRDLLEQIQGLENQLAGLKRRLVGSDQWEHPGGEQGTARLRLLIVRLPGRLGAVLMSSVEEVLRMVAIRAELEGPGVLGVVDYHGEPVAVLDPAWLLGAAPQPVRSSQSLVLCRAASLRVALRVEDIEDVVETTASAFQPSEEVLPGVLQGAGMVHTGSALALILEPALLALQAQVLRLGTAFPAGTGEGS